MKEIALPLSSSDTAALSVGERTSITGTVFTAREPVLKMLHEGGTLPFEARGSFLYHCGPLVKRVGSRWEVQAAGPDDSRNLEAFLGEIVGRFGFAGIIGRGGVGRTTLNVCRRYGAAYLQTFGGAALALAQHIESVAGVHFKDDFDARDAMWELQVTDFPAIVTIDSQGRSLPDIVRDVSSRRFVALTD